MANKGSDVKRVSGCKTLSKPKVNILRAEPKK